uniref:CSC1/OSCA1-like 7TM region domain-containing protein n=1 Tax=Zooxanthella nutricula TaxID=1333877 RepID=A0A7S2PRP4_9DINO
MAVRGLVALMFVEKIRRRIKRPIYRRSHREIIQRTLWLSGLPVYDREKGEPFTLTDDEFAEVAADLTTHINAAISRRTNGFVKAVDMEVKVAPVIDEQSRLRQSLNNVQEEFETYTELARVDRPGCWGGLESRYYRRQEEKARIQKVKLQAELAQLLSAKKTMSGSAFVTFQEKQYSDLFLKEKPRCYKCRRYTYFTFGKAPFTAVTLCCTRAAHPEDMNWLNLQITWWRQVSIGAVLTVALLIGMVTLTLALTFASQADVLVPALRRKLEVLAGWLSARADVLGRDEKFWYVVSKQVPALLLVVINSLVLPECISRISEAIRLHQKSSAHTFQLHVNLVFLVLNSLIIPVFGLTSIGAFVQWGEQRLTTFTTMQLVSEVAKKLMQSSGVFAVRYILSCACVSNTISLLQLAQVGYRAVCRRLARTPREMVEATQNFPFAWGYWYAWTISIFTIGMALSSFVPSVLPCSFLFFAAQHYVDRYNLTNAVFDHGPQSENVFITRALHYMRCIVAAWWIAMSVAFWVILDRGFMEDWDCVVPLKLVRSILAILVVASAWLLVWSWWDLQSILHDSNFQMVDLSDRSYWRNLLFSIFETCSGSAKKQYSKKEMKGDATDMEAFLSTPETPRVLELGGWAARPPAEPDPPPGSSPEGDEDGAEERGADPVPNYWKGTTDAELTWDACSAGLQSEPFPL